MKVFVLDKWRRPANRLDKLRLASVHPGRHARVWAQSFHRLHGWNLNTEKNHELRSPKCPKCELLLKQQRITPSTWICFMFFFGGYFLVDKSQLNSQAEKFQAVLSLLELKRTLLLLATGSGKSLCYQLPAYLCLVMQHFPNDLMILGIQVEPRDLSQFMWRFFVSHSLSSSRVQQRLWLVSLRYPQTKNSYIDSFTYVVWEPGSWTPVVPCWRLSWANSDKKTRWTWSLFRTLRLREEGLTLVVSPLVSLMQDQLARLPKCLFLGISQGLDHERRFALAVLWEVEPVLR